MVQEDHRLVRPEGLGDPVAFRAVEHDAGEIVEDGMISKKAQESCVSGSSLRPSEAQALPWVECV